MEYVSTPICSRAGIDLRLHGHFVKTWANLYQSLLAPGHMHHLPSLFYLAPIDSILWHAVRAMAFADVKNARNGEGVPFHIKARASYGMALTRVREAAQDEENLATDDALTALLLLDSFEVITFSLQRCRLPSLI